MDIYVRLYKTFDLDLICLAEAGYDLSKMLYVSLLSFASGTPCKIMLNRDIDMGLEDVQNLRIRCRLSNDSEQVEKLMSNIKPGKQCAFCKALLRNTLTCGNLRLFLNNGNYDASIIRDRSLIAVTDTNCIFSIDDFRKDSEHSLPLLSAPAKPIAELSEIRKEPKEAEIPQQTASYMPEIKNDKPKHNDYNELVDVSSDNTITGLLDEFPGLFG